MWPIVERAATNGQSSYVDKATVVLADFVSGFCPLRRLSVFPLSSLVDGHFLPVPANHRLMDNPPQFAVHFAIASIRESCII